MVKPILRIMSFFLKEINEVRRQPFLFLSLIGGPFLVLALFGATFQSSQPNIRAVLVWPEAGIQGIPQEKIEEMINSSFSLVDVTPEQSKAMQLLHAGRADVVQIVSQDIEEQIKSGKQPQIDIITDTIDPIREAWIQSMVYAEINLINREILKIRAQTARDKAQDVDVQLGVAREKIVAAEEEFSGQQIQTLRASLPEMQANLSALLLFLPTAESLGGASSREINQTRDSIYDVLDGIDDLEQAIDSGELETQIDEMKDFDTRLLLLQTNIEGFIGIPTDNLIAPVRSNYRNLHGKAYAMMVFYAPGVLALLLQHLSVTLGALALVRERQTGAFEIFRVAPLNLVQILIGKYLAYIVYVGATVAALTGLLRLLHIPMLGSWGVFSALVLVMTIASLGYGFLISALSTSDSQAIQLSMLVLLLSIFFSGFFLTLDGFHWSARILAALMPLTHGLDGFQRIMLRGGTPSLWTWLGLGAIAAALFLAVWQIMRRAYNEVR